MALGKDRKEVWGRPCDTWGKSSAGSGDRECEGPGAGTHCQCSRNRKERREERVVLRGGQRCNGGGTGWGNLCRAWRQDERALPPTLHGQAAPPSPSHGTDCWLMHSLWTRRGSGASSHGGALSGGGCDPFTCRTLWCWQFVFLTHSPPSSAPQQLKCLCRVGARGAN